MARRTSRLEAERVIAELLKHPDATVRNAVGDALEREAREAHTARQLTEDELRRQVCSTLVFNAMLLSKGLTDTDDAADRARSSLEKLSRLASRQGGGSLPVAAVSHDLLRTAVVALSRRSGAPRRGARVGSRGQAVNAVLRTLGMASTPAAVETMLKRKIHHEPIVWARARRS